jgi:hypothetical protein
VAASYFLGLFANRTNVNLLPHFTSALFDILHLQSRHVAAILVQLFRVFTIIIPQRPKGPHHFPCTEISFTTNYKRFDELFKKPYRVT